MQITAFTQSRTTQGLTVKFANSPPCACCGSSGQKSQYGLMMLAFQRFTAASSFIYGSLFLSGIYYCLSVFWCAIMRMSELELNFSLKLAIVDWKIQLAQIINLILLRCVWFSFLHTLQFMSNITAK